ncbi:MAG: ChrR family anti-sigma-E factor [Pseudomonadota bacterium]
MQNVTDHTSSTADDRYSELMANYAAGLLSPHARALVGAHLQLRPERRHTVFAFEAVGAAILADEETADIEDRDGMLSRIFAEEVGPNGNGHVNGRHANGGHMNGEGGTAQFLPSPLDRLVGMRFDDIPWRTRFGGMREYELETEDGSEAKLLWIKAGQSIPVHTHDGTEVTLVLKGSFEDTDGTYRAGDIAVADDTVDHKPVVSAEEDCICFAVMDAPVRLTGPIGRLLSPFMRR